MTQLSKAAFVTKYNDAGTGKYKAGQVEGIGSDDHREQIQDTADSVVFLGDIEDMPYEDEITISSASLLNSFTVRPPLVAAPGAGKALVPTYIWVSMDYNGIPYATNVNFVIEYDGGVQIVGPDPFNFLASSADRVIGFSIPLVDAVINEGIKFKTDIGNPINGNSAIKVRINYKIITI